MPWTEEGVTNIEYMRQYMANVEYQQLPTHVNPWAIYKCYSESRLRRLFLRQCVLLQTGGNLQSVVIAGSFVAHTYQCSIGAKPAWTPNDIDIFVTQQYHLRTIQQLFLTTFVKPLGKTLVCRENNDYIDEGKDERSFDCDRLPTDIEEFLLLPYLFSMECRCSLEKTYTKMAPCIQMSV